jgi:aldehyde dehydrogenase (NAD+)
MPIDTATHDRLARELFSSHYLLIGEDRVATTTSDRFEHVNPATGKVQAEVVMAGLDEVDRAVASAVAAQKIWWAWRPDERRNALNRLAALIRGDGDEVAKILSLEAGIPMTTALGLPRRAGDYLEYYAGYADKIEGQVIPIFPEQAFDYTLPEPYGVVAAISTWNGGISSLSRKGGAALAAGNAVVVKAMELAPFSAVRFGELALRAGLPPGLVNVIVGGPEAGAALVRHRDVGKVSFTGGVETARKILVTAAESITPVVLELGGKSGSIVFADADLDAAGQFSGAMPMGMAGQACVSPSRMIVHESVHDQVLERAAATARALPLGDPLDMVTVIGPVVSEGQYDRILGMIDRARQSGKGELITGGAASEGDLSAGFFIEPTIFDGLDSADYIAQEEVFGPVLSVITFSDEDEAVALANDTAYGLAGYVHTTDLKRAHRVAAKLDAGYISVNGFAALPASAPFGGHKLSGMGKEGGRAGLDEFLRTKNVYIPL